MKHLLIILISILLLSSPVIGDNHKGETLYRWGNTLHYVWKGFGDKDTHPVYKGNVKNGKPHVQGTETLSDGKKYEGEWKDGERNGHGIFTYPDDGRKYEGEWKGDIPWNGTGYDKNGNITTKVVNGKIYIQYPPLKPTPSSPVSDTHYFFISQTPSK